MEKLVESSSSTHPLEDKPVRDGRGLLSHWDPRGLSFEYSVFR